MRHDFMLGTLCDDDCHLFGFLKGSKGSIIQEEMGICLPYVLRWVNT